MNILTQLMTIRDLNDPMDAHDQFNRLANNNLSVERHDEHFVNREASGGQVDQNCASTELELAGKEG